MIISVPDMISSLYNPTTLIAPQQCVLNFRLCILSSRSANTPLVIFEQDTHDFILMVCEFMQNGKF